MKTDIDIVLYENEINDAIDFVESISAFNENEKIQQAIMLVELQDLHFEGLEDWYTRFTSLYPELVNLFFVKTGYKHVASLINGRVISYELWTEKV